MLYDFTLFQRIVHFFLELDDIRIKNDGQL